MLRSGHSLHAVDQHRAAFRSDAELSFAQETDALMGVRGEVCKGHLASSTRLRLVASISSKLSNFEQSPMKGQL